MKYEELVETVKKAMRKVLVSKGIGHVAYQFNVEGEGEGTFYLELDYGKVNVEPFEYYDRDLTIVTCADVLLKMVTGELKPMDAYANGQINVYGDLKQLELLPFGCQRKATAKAADE